MSARLERMLSIEEEIKETLKSLPEYMRKFDLILAEQEENSFNTRLQYIKHVAQFLDFMQQYKRYKLKNLNDLKQIQSVDVMEWKQSLGYYKGNDGKIYPTSNATIATKISAIKKFFNCFEDKLEKNPALYIKRPKIKDKEPVIVEDDEMRLLFLNVKNGIGSHRARSHQKRYYIRDMTILYILSCTGIRIAPLVGLNIEDVDLEAKTITVTSKGDVTSVKPLNDEVYEWVEKYYNQRITMNVETNALFISNQNRRINVRTVQAMIKKYSQGINKNISPHVFRKTFGTLVHQQTGDIKMVADLLDHSQIQTTSKYYVKSTQEKQKEILNNINFVHV